MSVTLKIMELVFLKNSYLISSIDFIMLIVHSEEGMEAQVWDCQYAKELLKVWEVKSGWRVTQTKDLFFTSKYLK